MMRSFSRSRTARCAPAAVRRSCAGRGGAHQALGGVRRACRAGLTPESQVDHNNGPKCPQLAGSSSAQASPNSNARVTCAYRRNQRWGRLPGAGRFDRTLFSTGVHGEDQVSIRRRDFAKANFAQPVHLRFQRRASIMLLALDGCGEVRFVGASFARRTLPILVGAPLEVIALGQNHFSIDEYATFAQRTMDALEERAFLIVLQMMNREPGYNRVETPGEGILAVIEQGVTQARIERAFFAGKSFLRELQHLRRDIGQQNFGVREVRRDELREHADRKSTRLNSSHDQISYAVFCLKKKKKRNKMIRVKKKKNRKKKTR